jgi:hypothetical protein
MEHLATAACPAIAAHLGKVPLPETRTGQFQDSPRFCPSNKIPEGEIDRSRIGFDTRKPDCFFQELFIKHKICTFHVYSVHEPSS